MAHKKEAYDSHICDTWEDVILPNITCLHVLKTHDYPMNTYCQKTICSAAKQLSALYHHHWSQEATQLPVMPTKIPPESIFYPLALEATISLKSAMAAHAFPKTNRPQDKERIQVLKAVMGKDLSPEEYKQAYQTLDNKCRGKGGGGDSGQGNGGGGGGGQGKGKGKGKGKKGKNKGQSWRQNQDKDKEPDKH